MDRDLIGRILQGHGINKYYTTIEYMPHFEVVTIHTRNYFFFKNRTLLQLQNATVGVNFYFDKPSFINWILKRP